MMKLNYMLWLTFVPVNVLNLAALNLIFSVRNLSVIMDKFVKRTPAASNVKSKQGYVSAKRRSLDPEFKSVFHEDNGLLYCKCCNKVVDHVRRDSVVSHCKTSMHVKKVERFQADIENISKRQKAVESTINAKTEASRANKDLNIDWCRTLTTANIPLHKTDHPAIQDFLKRRVENGGAIVCSTALRSVYFPIVSSIHQNELEEIISESIGYSVIADETDDSANDRAFYNILFTPTLISSNDPKLVSYLLKSRVITDEAVNHSFAARELILACSKLDYNKIIAIVTDNVAYMRKAFTDILSPLFPYAIHVTCSAHLFNLICKIIFEEMKDISSFITSWRALFTLNRGRKRRFIIFLTQINVRNAAAGNPN